jgi:hypothetical protein
MKKAACFQSLLLYICRFPHKQGLLIKQNLAFLSKSLVKRHPSRSPNQVSMEKDAPFPEPLVYSFIQFYLTESPVKELSRKTGGKRVSLSMEPHADGRPTYNVVWPGSPWGSFMTLLLLSQCHAAFSTIPSTLAWVD